MDGSIFLPRRVRDAWSGLEDVHDVNVESGRDVSISKMDAVRISEEHDRARERKDREGDIYYQYYCTSAAQKIYDSRENVERAWSKVREIERERAPFEGS